MPCCIPGKKNKLPVIMLSSSHFEGVVSTDEARKPELILDYNKQKGGVDMFDENVEEFSCRKKTVRWPLLFFYNLLDTATNNAYILLKKSGTYTCSKKVCLKYLTFDLAKPAVDTRLKLSGQKESVKTAAIQMGFSLTKVPAPQNPNTGASESNQKTRCRECKKYTRTRCDVCSRGVCPLHRRLLKSCRCMYCDDVK